MFHHQTIRKYTAALLDYFNNLEVQYTDSSGSTVIKNVPITFASKEKSRTLSHHTNEQLMSGNYNVLPRANLSMSTIVKSEQRTTNKNIKIAKKTNSTTYDYMFNAVPYEFTFEVAVMCRGMNEAAQIIEQIVPQFNPTLNLDIWDAENLDTPTRVPVRLLDIGLETNEYEEFSSNIVTVSIGISILGNLYSPIKSVNRIKQFKLVLNEQQGASNQFFSRKIINNWDVDYAGMPISPGTSVQVQDTKMAPVIIDIIPVSPLIVATNKISVIWNDPDNRASEMTFTWSLLQGAGTFFGNTDTVDLTITAAGTIEVQVKITDPFGNFATLSKIFTVN